MLILKVVKVICFDALLQVLILSGLSEQRIFKKGVFDFEGVISKERVAGEHGWKGGKNLAGLTKQL